MAEFEHRPDQEDISPKRISRRGVLKGALGLGIAATPPRPHEANAFDAGDGSEGEIEQPLIKDAFKEGDARLQKQYMGVNKEVFEGKDLENINELLNITPKFSFSDRTVSNLVSLDHPSFGRVQANIADSATGTEQYPTLGIISPLSVIGSDGEDIFRFQFSGIPLGVTKVPFKSEDPGYHDEHGELFAHIGQVGIINGVGEGNLRSVMPVFLFLTGEDESMKFPMWFNERDTQNGPLVLDGGEFERREYTQETTSSVVERLNDNIGDSIVTMTIGSPYIGSTLAGQIMDLGFPSDMLEDDFQKTQSKYTERYYREIMQRLAISQASTTPDYSIWMPTNAGSVLIPYNEAGENVEGETDIKKRIPRIEKLLKKEFVTADDVVKLLQPVTVDLFPVSSQ